MDVFYKYMLLVLLTTFGQINGFAQKSETIDFSDYDFNNGQYVDSVVGKYCSVVFDIGTNSRKTNSPCYYKDGLSIRIYSGNTMTVKSKYFITSIIFTYDSGSNYCPTTDNSEFTPTGYDYDKCTWTGSSNSVQLQRVNTSKGHFRIQKLDMTFSSESSGVDNMYADDAADNNIKVYSLSGIYLGNSLQNLPKGVYIVNKKKYVIR
jgi:hypothetical protein